MAKNLLFLLLLSAFAHSLWATSSPTENAPRPLETCELPPPDSFHVETIGVGFNTLAWQPILQGATHTLVVLEAPGNSNNWTPIDTIYNLVNTHTVTNLQSTSRYQFKIATNCSGGDPSTLFAIIDGITLILELDISGRVPINPEPVPCSNIDLSAHEWVGFSITYAPSQGIVLTNLFEIVRNEGDIIVGNSSVAKYTIKRVVTEHVLVAAEKVGHLWPTPIKRPVDVFDPTFEILRRTGPNSFDKAGELALTESQNLINICISGTPHWNNQYSFTPLVAEESNGFGIPSTNRNESDFTRENGVKAQTLFRETLDIFFPPQDQPNQDVTLYLMNSGGNILLQKHLDTQTGQATLNTDFLPAGLYLLRVQTPNGTQVFKAIKPE
jgi:hypothetical protein